MDYSQVKRIATQCEVEILLFWNNAPKIQKFVAAIEANERRRIADKLGIAVESLEDEK